MRAARWATCLWPGLPPLWARGSLLGLALAVGWGSMLNLLLVASLVWTELLDRTVLLGGWGALGGGWFLALLVNCRWLAGQSGTGTDGADDELFAQALDYYLKGEWIEAELVLQRLLERRPADAEGRLLRATLWRRTGRLTEAGHELDRLQRLEAAGAWQWEIAAERQLLEELAAAPTPKQSEPADGPSEAPAVLDAAA